MSVCVLATVYVPSVPMLVLARFISGLGIGSILASTATLTAGYAPARTKDFWFSFVMSGYPIGAVLSGMVAAWIIPDYGWRAHVQYRGCGYGDVEVSKSGVIRTARLLNRGEVLEPMLTD